MMTIKQLFDSELDYWRAKNISLFGMDLIDENKPFKEIQETISKCCELYWNNNTVEKVPAAGAPHGCFAGACHTGCCYVGVHLVAHGCHTVPIASTGVSVVWHFPLGAGSGHILVHILSDRFAV